MSPEAVIDQRRAGMSAMGWVADRQSWPQGSDSCRYEITPRTGYRANSGRGSKRILNLEWASRFDSKSNRWNTLHDSDAAFVPK